MPMPMQPGRTPRRAAARLLCVLLPALWLGAERLASARSVSFDDRANGGRLPATAAETATVPVGGETSIPFLDGPSCPLEERLFADAADGRLDEHSLLQAALVASGVSRETTIHEYENQVAALVVRLRKSGKLTETPYQRAQAVFEFMHQHALRGGYSIHCTDLRTTLDEGRFNCVSGSVLFNHLAGEVGLVARGLEIPGHAMSRLTLPEKSLDVETTCPRWFRLIDDPEQRAELVKRTIGRDPSRHHAEAREISPVEMVAMIYYNRGVDLLAEKRFEEAAVANAKALRLDPASTTARGNLLATINNWAIDLGHEQKFAEAADLLRKGLAFDPHYETLALNYIHVHHQWVGHLCGAGAFEEALAVLARAAAELPGRDYFRRAPAEVYRRWARWHFAQGDAEGGFAVLDRARRTDGTCRELLEAEEAAVNDHALELLERGQFEEALAWFDRGLARQDDAELLRDNRRVAVMRWAEEAFRRGNYAEAIRRTTYGAGPEGLHASLRNNVRWGYHQWITELRAAGHYIEAERVAQQASADPYLQKN